MLNFFYLELDENRWLSFDSFPRAVYRRMLREPRRSGDARVFLDQCKGLGRGRCAHMDDTLAIQEQPW